MSEQKKAKYFCESCGAEVAAKAKFCPKCGKFFSSVRCPKCGKLGNVNDFKHGCPQCHYAMSQEELYGTTEENTLDGRKHKLSFKSKRRIKEAFREHERKTEGGDGAPLWLFVCAIALLLVVTALIFYRCQ